GGGGGGGGGLPEERDSASAAAAGVTLDGSLNAWRDRDDGWTLELAVPVSALNRYGASFGMDHTWTILVARYNYSVHLPERELSSMPGLPRRDCGFRGPAWYARLRLTR
ncbi:MAG: hypothetical protein JXB13_05705, partial [Phycisphaerae bacterium]|nr:hypothetical protein [Phycisphaerae bacterium]